MFVKRKFQMLSLSMGPSISQTSRTKGIKYRSLTPLYFRKTIKLNSSSIPSKSWKLFRNVALSFLKLIASVFAFNSQNVQYVFHNNLNSKSPFCQLEGAFFPTHPRSGLSPVVISTANRPCIITHTSSKSHPFPHPCWQHIYPSFYVQVTIL